MHNNTPVHIVDVPVEKLSFCRGVMGAGYTAKNQTYASKRFTRNTQNSEKRERERNKIHANQTIFGSVSLPKTELHVECFSKITPCYMLSTNPMDVLQSAGVPSLKSASWDPVNFTAKCLALEILFSNCFLS